MTKVLISAVLAVHNEQDNLEKCLLSIKNLADEIVIADEKSTDNTLKIASKYKAKVIEADHHDNFHITKNIAIDAARGEWILQLDADEVVSSELANEIKTAIADEKFNGYWVNRRNWFLDRFLTKGGQYPDPTLRLYRRGKGKLPAQDVHEQATVEGEVGHLKNDLLHYRDISFEKYLQGFNRYSTFISLQLKSKNTKFNILNTIDYLFIKPIIIFLNIYLRHRGYVDGFPGFVFALFSGLIQPVAYIKYWQQAL